MAKISGIPKTQLKLPTKTPTRTEITGWTLRLTLTFR